MKRLLAALLLLPTLVFGAANDVIITQRNTADNGTVTRFMTPPTGGANGVIAYNGSTQMPLIFNIGTGLSVTGTSLVALPQSWNTLTDKPTLFSGSYNDLFDKPAIPAAQVNSDWTATSGVAQILNKPTLFSGAYADLTGKPTLFDGTWASLTGKPTFATVATSGSYVDLTNKPTIPAAGS